MSAVDGLDEHEVARRSAAVMIGGDRFSAGLGMEVTEVGPDHAVVEMTVRPDMLNGWGNGHGGVAASLADTAFAVACNSRGTVTVAAGFDVTFLAPVHEGDRLVATAAHRSSAGRSGVYDVTVTRADGDPVVEFRGRSRSLGTPIDLGEPPAATEAKGAGA